MEKQVKTESFGQPDKQRKQYDIFTAEQITGQHEAGDYCVIVMHREDVVSLNKIATQYFNNLEAARRRGRQLRAVTGGGDERRRALPPLPLKLPVGHVALSHLSAAEASKVFDEIRSERFAAKL